MTTKEAIEYFGSVKKLSLVLNISVQGIYRWGEHPPMLRQYQIERITRKRLKAATHEKN